MGAGFIMENNFIEKHAENRKKENMNYWDDKKEINKFEDAKQFEDNSIFNQMNMQDKITTKLTSKGELQAEVRIGGVLTTIADINKVVGQHLYAWNKLKEMFPNLIKPKEKKEW